jgi:hypothetical protein
MVTAFTTDTDNSGNNAVTLANGIAGQLKVLYTKVEATSGQTTVVTPATLAGYTTITFDAVGDSALLYYSTLGWVMVGGSATIA